MSGILKIKIKVAAGSRGASNAIEIMDLMRENWDKI